MPTSKSSRRTSLQHGILQPIVVHPADEEGRYRMHFGAKRWRAAKRAGTHHLALLALPPVLDAAMRSGRCSSPRTLYELGKLHAQQPGRVAELVAGTNPITRDAVAEIRDAASATRATASEQKPQAARPDRLAQMLSHATGLCDKLDAALARLARNDLGALPADDLATLRQRIQQLAHRIEA